MMKNKEFSSVIILSVIICALFSAPAFFVDLKCGVAAVASDIALIAVFIVYTKKRYKKISELNNYLSLVCAGNYELDINDNAEGELSILKNNLFKIITLLRSSNEELKKEKSALADSLADISHQLKTPLTSMMVMTQVLKDEKNSEKQSYFVSIIENQLNKMKWLITTLLKLSKLDAGTADFYIRSVNIKDVLNESIKPFLITIDLKNIKLVQEIENFTFCADENWCSEAIGNIIKNCIEHTPEYGEIFIGANKTTIFNEIVISDNGTGISENDLPHIFERFYQGNNASPESIGIGLALSKAIINKENGDISVESKLGEGTKFTIRFYETIV